MSAPTADPTAGAGARTRVDLLISRVNSRGRIERFFIEVKNGASAGPTKHQSVLFPTFHSTGLVARGANATKAGLEVGKRYFLPGFASFL